jgi:hypothetical protein
MKETAQYTAFDLETARILPEGTQNWSRYRPLGITCAATLSSGGDLKLWYGRTADGDYAPQMSRDEARQLVWHLQAEADAGKAILTWNGLGFDFDILAEESGEYAICKDLALEHIDMMFHVFCMKGYGLSLDKAAKGMGLLGKPPGISGEMAPRMWKGGRYPEVLEYLSQDVQTTLDLGVVTSQQRQLRWISSRGKLQQLPLFSGWLQVKEAMDLPLPDTSWMSNPWPRSKFTGWLSS